MDNLAFQLYSTNHSNDSNEHRILGIEFWLCYYTTIILYESMKLISEKLSGYEILTCLSLQNNSTK